MQRVEATIALFLGRGGVHAHIDQDERAQLISSEHLDIGQCLMHRQRPAGQNHRRAAQVIDQLLVVLGPPPRIISLGRLVGGSLGAWVQGDYVVVSTEIFDLGLPDFCRHRPSGHEDDGGTGATLQVVEPDAIAGGKEAIFHGGCPKKSGEKAWTKEAKRNGRSALFVSHTIG